MTFSRQFLQIHEDCCGAAKIVSGRCKFAPPPRLRDILRERAQKIFEVKFDSVDAAQGVFRRSAHSVVATLLQTLFLNTRGRGLERLSAQAAALLSRCADDMSAEQRRLTATLANLWSINHWRRARLLWREGLMRRGLLRIVALGIVVTKHDAEGPALSALARAA